MLGGTAYTRDRPAEFDTRGVSPEALVARIEAVRDLVQHVVGGLAVERLSAPLPGSFSTNRCQIEAVLVHLNDTNYHLGQVDYMPPRDRNGVILSTSIASTRVAATAGEMLARQTTTIISRAATPYGIGSRLVIPIS